VIAGENNHGDIGAFKPFVNSKRALGSMDGMFGYGVVLDSPGPEPTYR